MNEIIMKPIGLLRCPETAKFETPHQPNSHHCRQATVELYGQWNFEVALRDLEGFSKIWLIWWFHKNQSWRPTTRPPRGRPGRKGTFATRSPYRPNPIAMSAVDLISVEGRTLTIGHHDLIDGTPILDIKPYIPAFDSFPEESIGWLQDIEDQESAGAKFHLTIETEAQERLNWLELHEPGVSKRIESLLSYDPYPHKTRRIAAFQGIYRLSCGDWRVLFDIEGREVRIRRLQSRYQPEQNDTPEIHLSFLKQFPALKKPL